MRANPKCPAILAGLAGGTLAALPSASYAATGLGPVVVPSLPGSVVPFAFGAAMGAAVACLVMREPMGDGSAASVHVREVSNEPGVTHAAVRAREVESSRPVGRHVRAEGEATSSWVTRNRPAPSPDDYENLWTGGCAASEMGPSEDADVSCVPASNRDATGYADAVDPMRSEVVASAVGHGEPGSRGVDAGGNPAPESEDAAFAAFFGNVRESDDYADIAEQYVRRQTFAQRMAARARGVAGVLGERLGADMMDGVPVIERADGSVGDVGTVWWDQAVADVVRRDFGETAPPAQSRVAEQPTQADVAQTAAQAGMRARAAWQPRPGRVAERVADFDMGVYPERRVSDGGDDVWQAALDAMDEQVGGAMPSGFADIIGSADTLDEPDGLECPTHAIPFRVPAGHPEVVDTESYVDYLINDEFSRNGSRAARSNAHDYLKVINGGTSSLGATRRGQRSSRGGGARHVPRHMAAREA